MSPQWLQVYFMTFPEMIIGVLLQTTAIFNHNNKVVYHTSDTFAGTLFGAKYMGIFDIIHCDGILETKLFQQAGGGLEPRVVENKKMFFNWEDVL